MMELLVRRREASAAGFQAIAPEENSVKTADDLLAFRGQSESAMRLTMESLAGIVSDVETAKKGGDEAPDKWLEVLTRASESTARYLPILGEIAAYKKAMARPPPLLAQFDRMLRPYEKSRPEYRGEWQAGSMNLVLAPADIERMEMLESVCQDVLSELSAAQTLIREHQQQSGEQEQQQRRSRSQGSSSSSSMYPDAGGSYADNLVKLVSDSVTGIQVVLRELP